MWPYHALTFMTQGPPLAELPGSGASGPTLLILEARPLNGGTIPSSGVTIAAQGASVGTVDDVSG